MIPSGRTSTAHPLKIATVSAGPGMGAVGITFCPGKVDPQAHTGPWQRDLDLDLDAVVAWNAAAVVCLMEQHELDRLQVPELGAAVTARGLSWLPLPIRDTSIPDGAFEAAWAEKGEALREHVRCGSHVLVYCRGGLGRSGMIAARLLVELGWQPAKALAAVREVRPGAIETRAQEEVVRRAHAIPPRRGADGPEARLDRAVGALLGLAVGDALGTTLEFSRRDQKPPVTDLVGGGPFRLKPGQWTDDTAMALALADSLLACRGLAERDLMERFTAWYREGRYSCTGTCFDIGTTTRAVLERFAASGNPIAGSTDSRSAGNGSLMRLAPIALFYSYDLAAAREAAARQSRTTHGADEAVDACVFFTELLLEAIAGAPRSEVLRQRTETVRAPKIAAIAAGSWRGRPRDAIRSSGYVVDSLEAALWSVSRAGSFREAVVPAANLADDADTVAAITGQLAGALWGAGGIPVEWRRNLASREEIETQARALAGTAKPRI